MIETEPEDDSDSCDKTEEERLNEYKQFVQTNAVFSDKDGNDKELESLATLGKEALLADKQFRKFKKRVAREPKQVYGIIYYFNLIWLSHVSLLLYCTTMNKQSPFSTLLQSNPP